ncbi:MAG: SAM-dependent methyltransferase [Gammaproteobacteria bacterium]
MSDLPAPSAQALAHSERLVGLIRREILDGGGVLPFSRYMELCLYSPGHGYYSAGSQKFGAAGDYVTAPEISLLFGRCLARTCNGVLEQLEKGDILEFGAGTGALAATLLAELERLGRLPGRYLILELSGELRSRQQETLRRLTPRLLERVDWLDGLPEGGFRGVLLANEVLDAMPVERFRWNGDGIGHFHVECRGDAFGWCAREAHDPELVAAVRRLAEDPGLLPGYVSEINLLLSSWLQGIATILDRGLLLVVDYGYPRHEYYHPQHREGTLMCHYRHRAHENPFLWPGLQDITAHVDFTAVAEAGVATGLDVVGYTSQAWFLLDCGLDSLLQAAGPTDSAAYLRQAREAKTLILPGEMGERFKCIGLGRDLEDPVPGFRGHDLRYRL